VTVIIFVAVAFAVGYAIWHFEHPPEPSHSGRHRSRYYREEGLPRIARLSAQFSGSVSGSTSTNRLRSSEPSASAISQYRRGTIPS